jgi:alpha-L-fucosidase 2
MGAMVFGGTARERIQFNESSVWAGEPHDYSHKGAAAHLGTIRQLLFAGKQKEAEALAMREFMSIPLRQKPYQAFGDLLIELPGIAEDEVTGYRRELNLDTAIASVEYAHRGVTYRREVFASYPAQAVVVRLSASRRGSLSFEAGFGSAHEGGVMMPAGNEQVSMTGQVKGGAIRFEARLLVRATGGKQSSRGERLAVEGADSALLILSGATNFRTFQDVSGDPKQRNDQVIASVRGKTYESLLAAHSADHQRLFRRVTLDLDGRASKAAEPTDARIAAFASGSDPGLVELLFHYGRYLLIASSRAGGHPANLQGLWNDTNTPPWDSKYTVNINTEMNYWPAEVTNLAECHEPLFDAMQQVSEAGAITAKEHYNARGWVLHHNFDLWRGTAPINNSNHGIWPTGGAWLATHFWERYLFSGDKEFLRSKAYPLMRGAALFFVDALVKHPEKGWLISGPSNSPEQGGLVMGPTMDHQIIRALFGQVIAAATILNTDAPLRDQLASMRKRIAPNQIGRHGQLQEWLEDKDDPANQHRHVSHLWGVHPGDDITAYGSPELFAAAKKSLELRGDAATGWSMGWKINFWARFLDGDHAYTILRNLIQPASERTAGLYRNLFDAHPPFQIDGNFGATAGIAEMLVQSHDPYAKPGDLTPVQSGASAFVHLLPALPSVFPTGKVTGLRARGGFDVEIEWRGGKLVRARLIARHSKPVTVRYAGREIKVEAKAGGSYEFNEELARLRPQ